MPRRADLVQALALVGNRRFRLVGVVDDDSNSRGSESLVLGDTDDLPHIIATVKPDLVAFGPGCNRPEVFAQLLNSAAAGFRVLELAQFYEHAFGRVPVRDITRAWFMSVLHLYQRPYPRFAKRTTDVLGATILLTLTAPLFPVLAFFVRRTPGPVFLRQTRIGEHGQLFTMFKFRTMRDNAEQPGEAVWAAKDDPRITSYGRIMRRLRLDELPQIWNVLTGEMSLIGPRPERPEFIDELLEAVPFWSRRQLVKPGITGWAQVKRGYTAGTDGSCEKLLYDLWYIRHRSLTVDLVICARTIATVLRGEPQPRPQQDGLLVASASTASGTSSELDPMTTLLHYTQGATPETEHI